MNGTTGSVDGIRYSLALARFLNEEPGSELEEEALTEAYQLGRESLQAGLSILDLTSQHHQALAGILGSAPAGTRLAKAATFLTECLSPYEMSLRGYREASAQLAKANEQLQQAFTEAKATNAHLLEVMAERQRAEDALRQGQKMQVVGQLAGGVAHHFNNLLTVVLNDIKSGISQVRGNVATTQVLKRALTAAELGAKLVSELLTFSRNQILQPEAIAPSERLLDIASLIGGSVGRQINITMDVPSGLPKIDVDPNHLTLCMLNLAGNAKDAMPAGGTIRISAEHRRFDDERIDLKGDYVVVEVADNGTGIEADVLPRVFEPFFTTKDVGSGNGLGLSQVHGFAHQSGGTVEIETEIGKGTTVRLYLRSRSPKAASSGAGRQSSGTGVPSVLVVEDERIVAAAAAASLKRMGFAVKLVHDAHAALDILQKGLGVDIVFSDIKMPGTMNGIDLAEVIKTQFPETIVVLTTGYHETANSAVASGFKIISKPYRLDELANQLKDLLRAED